MPRPIAVVDTSALVPPGKRRRLILAASEGLCKLYWSPWIVAELNRVLTCKWIERHGTGKEAQIAMSKTSKEMMTILSQFLDVVDAKPPWMEAWPSLTDTGDLPIYTTAHLIHADYVVSENTRDFPPADAYGRHIWNGIEYIRVDDFLRVIEFEED